MPREKHSREVEIDEVIPPGERAPTDPSDPLQKLVAHLLDNLFKIPGTKIRFGLDPILGLLPGFGDTVSGLISTAMLSIGLRRGIPRVVVMRMAANILLNALLGAVPVLGDAFSFWFKSNVRNYELYKEYAGGTRRSTRGDWIFLIALLSVVAFLIIGIAGGFIWLVTQAGRNFR